MAAAMPLFERAGIAGDHLDEGCVSLSGEGDVRGFIEYCGKLRYWDREPRVDRA